LVGFALDLCSLCLCAEAPCLSFDVVTDALGGSREEFPLTCYLVAGTQASRAQANSVILMKLSNLCKTQKSHDNSDDDDRWTLQTIRDTKNMVSKMSFCVCPKSRISRKILISV